MSVTASERMTAAEYLATGDERPRSTELIEGEVVVNEPTSHHQDAAGEIYFALRTWIAGGADRGHASIPIDVQVTEADVFAPDVSWYRAERTFARTDEPPYPLPDLAVEVRSPSIWRYDLGPKKARYEALGLPELWLVDTVAETVLVFRRSRLEGPSFDVLLELRGDEELGSPLLPGFALPVRAVFAG